MFIRYATNKSAIFDPKRLTRPKQKLKKDQFTNNGNVHDN